MKLLSNRILAFVVVSSGFLLAATSCKKSNSGGGGSAGVHATVGATAWASNFPVSGVHITSADQYEIGGVQIANHDTTAFAILFTGPVALNHAISSDTAFSGVGYIHGQTEYDGGEGIGHSIITVTSYDANGKKIGGTFSGVLYNLFDGNDSLVVTNGTFSTTYIEQ
jgi:hypothetical protein